MEISLEVVRCVVKRCTRRFRVLSVSVLLLLMSTDENSSYQPQTTNNCNSYSLTKAYEAPRIFAITYQAIQGPQRSPWYRVALAYVTLSGRQISCFCRNRRLTKAHNCAFSRGNFSPHFHTLLP